MKKHIIAAAVTAALAAPAMAQNVSLSGLLDAGVSQTKADVGTSSTKSSASGAASSWSTSTLVFTATEDLGGGLKASAVISSFFDSTSGSTGNGLADNASTSYNTVGGRDRFLRIEGSFGGLQIGRFTPQINGYCTYACAGGTNNTAGTTDSSGSDLVAGTLGGRSTHTDNPAANTNPFLTPTAYTSLTSTTEAVNAAHMEHQSGVIEYTTPVVSGFSATLSYISGAVDSSSDLGSDKVSQHGLRVNYSAGPLAVSLANASRKWETEADTAAEQDSTKSKINWIGASYDLGAAKLFASHATRKDELKDGTAAPATVSDISVSTIGVQIPMGALTLTASMYSGDDDASSSATDNRDLKGHQLTAKYALSKRTFAYIAHGTNKDTRTDSSQTNNDFKRTQTNLGLVHSF